MSLLAPPKPPQEDLEALIREARHRARRRRLAYFAAGVLALAIAGGVYAILAWTGGGGTRPSVAEGFHLVPAESPVAHARIAQYTPFRPTVIDLENNSERRVPFVLEEWWDRKSGLERAVFSIDGRVLGDTVGQACQPKPRFCFPPPPPFELARYGLKWPVDERRFRVLGSGTFHGRNVIWVRSLMTNIGANRGDRFAYDVRTHELVGKRSVVRGRLFSDEIYTRLPDLPASSFSFVVPEGGGALHSFPPEPQPDTQSHSSSVAATRNALETVPLWLGPRFQGERLQSIEVGTEAMKARNGARLRPARFVRFDYGTVQLQEFGRERPFWYEQDPRPGRIVLDGRAALTRHGLLVIVQRDSPMTRAAALAVAKALRPVPS
jgi:hypothetical protein